MSGVISNDRKLAAEVRKLTLNKIKAILERPAVDMNEKDKELHDALLLKLASTVLPRLQEVTGEDGEPIKLAFDPVFNQIANAEPTRQAEGDSSVPSQV